MSMGSRNGKKPTVKEMAKKAQEMDDRRQVQIATQVGIINRQLNEVMLLDGALQVIANGVEGEAKAIAVDALAKLEELRADARKEMEEGLSSDSDGV